MDPETSLSSDFPHKNTSLRRIASRSYTPQTMPVALPPDAEPASNKLGRRQRALSDRVDHKMPSNTYSDALLLQALSIEVSTKMLLSQSDSAIRLSRVNMEATPSSAQAPMTLPESLQSLPQDSLDFFNTTLKSYFTEQIKTNETIGKLLKKFYNPRTLAYLENLSENGLSDTDKTFALGVLQRRLQNYLLPSGIKPSDKYNDLLLSNPGPLFIILSDARMAAACKQFPLDFWRTKLEALTPLKTYPGFPSVTTDTAFDKTIAYFATLHGNTSAYQAHTPLLALALRTKKVAMLWTLIAAEHDDIPDLACAFDDPLRATALMRPYAAEWLPYAKTLATATNEKGFLACLQETHPLDMILSVFLKQHALRVLRGRLVPSDNSYVSHMQKALPFFILSAAYGNHSVLHHILTFCFDVLSRESAAAPDVRTILSRCTTALPHAYGAEGFLIAAYVHKKLHPRQFMDRLGLYLRASLLQAEPALSLETSPISAFVKTTVPLTIDSFPTLAGRFSYRLSLLLLEAMPENWFANPMARNQLMAFYAAPTQPECVKKHDTKGAPSLVADTQLLSALTLEGLEAFNALLKSANENSVLLREQHRTPQPTLLFHSLARLPLSSADILKQHAIAHLLKGFVLPRKKARTSKPSAGAEQGGNVPSQKP